MLHDFVVQNSDKFQLLCANCNWIKKHENNENTSGLRELPLINYEGKTAFD